MKVVVIWCSNEVSQKRYARIVLGQARGMPLLGAVSRVLFAAGASPRGPTKLEILEESQMLPRIVLGTKRINLTQDFHEAYILRHLIGAQRATIASIRTAISATRVRAVVE
jgi:hypothetical protein